VFEADFSGLVELDADGVIYTKEVEDPSALGVTLVEDGFVTRLIEKPSPPISTQATVGIYYFANIEDLFTAIDEQIRREIRTKDEYFIADAIQLMIDVGKKFVTNNIDIWEDCGDVDALLQANRYLLSSDPPTPVKRTGSIIIPPSFVDRTALIENAIIGPHASIGAGALIRDSVVRDTVVEDGVSLDGVVIEHSLIGRQASIVGRPYQLTVADLTRVLL
jgi:glucose-1-phosphate thymidylyltransferase